MQKYVFFHNQSDAIKYFLLISHRFWRNKTDFDFELRKRHTVYTRRHEQMPTLLQAIIRYSRFVAVYGAVFAAYPAFLHCYKGGRRRLCVLFARKGRVAW